MIQETFGMLLRSRAHWEFELFLMLIFDGLLAGLLIPFGHRQWKRHIARELDWSLNDPILLATPYFKPDPYGAITTPPTISECGETKTRLGWWCTRAIGHAGPCAAISFLDWAARTPGQNPAKNHDEPLTTS